MLLNCSMNSGPRASKSRFSTVVELSFRTRSSRWNIFPAMLAVVTRDMPSTSISWSLLRTVFGAGEVVCPPAISASIDLLTMALWRGVRE
jgi:hypothetical protein